MITVVFNTKLHEIVKLKSLGRFQLLIKRRRNIGVTMPSIIFVVVPIYYLDKVIINIGHIFSKIRNNKKTENIMDSNPRKSAY
jgi:hypothetical protein